MEAQVGKGIVVMQISEFLPYLFFARAWFGQRGFITGNKVAKGCGKVEMEEQGPRKEGKSDLRKETQYTRTF